MNAPSRIVDTPQRYRLRVEDFLLLNDNGAFADYTKTELIDGEVFGVNAQYATHARVKSRLHVRLAMALAALGYDLEALVEVTVRVADDGAPEPDIVLTRWKEGGIVPADTVVLVIEVAETTLDTDLGRKAQLYAAAGIPEYWVVDVNESRVLMHEHPDTHGYQRQLDVPFGEPLLSEVIAGLKVETGRLLD